MKFKPRKWLEKIENEKLEHFDSKSSLSIGRTLHGPEKDDYRTYFQRDRDRILYSKYFKDLQYKTQVFLISEGDFYRTRLTHTLEVSQHARTLARAIKLNEDLCEAISYAHVLVLTCIISRYMVMFEQGGNYYGQKTTCSSMF